MADNQDRENEVDLRALTGIPSCGVLCELANADGTMARLPEAVAFSRRYDFPVLTVQDIIAFQKRTKTLKAS